MAHGRSASHATRTRIRVLVARGGAATAQSCHAAALNAYRLAWGEQERTAPLSRHHAQIGLLLGEAALRAGDVEVARGAYRRVTEIANALADSHLAAIARAGMDRVLTELFELAPVEPEAYER